MPVHRHLHEKLGSVYAFASELDAWQSRRDGAAGAAERNDSGDSVLAVTPARRMRRGLLWLIVVLAVAGAGALLLLRQRTDYFWRNPLASATFTRLTDFEGTEHAAAISRDGKFAAFLADRDGPVDVWVTQIGTGQFHNLTRGRVRDVVNPDVRNVGFSPDATFVSVWTRSGAGAEGGAIGVLAIPTLGGEPRLYLDGAAELDWTRDGTRVVYHTSAAGDPLFVSDHNRQATRKIYTAPAGLHSHFPIWSPDDSFIYFVHGAPPHQMDIWRIDPSAGKPERITTHASRVSHPAFLDKKTLLYLATDADGSGPWLYATDVERRKPRRITSGVDRYTSLAASADGRRIVATVANPRRTLWRMPIADGIADESKATRVTLPSLSGRSPRLGRGSLVYVSSKSNAEGIWKLAGGNATELWSGAGARVLGAPAVAPDGRRIAFVAAERGRPRMYVMNSDGSALRVSPEPLVPQGSPAWAPDGESIVVAATIGGSQCLAKVSADAQTFKPLISGLASDPVWSPDGKYLVYSGPDIATTFQVHVASADGRPRRGVNIRLPRGSRRLAFLPGQDALVVSRGEPNRKNFWVLDLQSGRERPLTAFDSPFVVGDFDVSADGREIIFDREHDDSDIVLIER